MGLEHFDTVLSFALVMLLLSLLITILVQTVVAVFGLRGSTLQWGLQRLFQQLSPELNLKDHAKQLAKAVLTHPALAHTLGRKATAIRPEELLRVLDDLSKNTPAELAQVKGALEKALHKTVPGDTPEQAEKARAVVCELTQSFGELAGKTQQLEQAVERALEANKQLEVEVNTWFNTIMDRTTERFVLHTRWVTAALAALLALGLHIDSLQILKQLSSSSELRAKLIQGVDATVQKVGTAVTDTQKPQPLASSAIRAMQDDMEDPADKALLEKVPPDLATRQAGEDWLSKNLPSDKLAKALPAYAKRFQESTIAWAQQLGVFFDNVTSSAEQTSLQIIPRPLPAYITNWNPNRRHILGTLMSALFLSLGAPFWFNALRQLASVRPILAGKVEKEKKQTS